MRINSKSLFILLFLGIVPVFSSAFSSEPNDTDAVGSTNDQQEDFSLFNYKRFLLDENGKWSVGLGTVVQNSPFRGETRSGKAMNIPLHSGDLLIFGGAARRHYHGVKKLENDCHPLTGDYRYNLTFRKAL